MKDILCYQFYPTSLPSVKYINQTCLTPQQPHIRRSFTTFWTAVCTSTKENAVMSCVRMKC